jgi:hypothetical protein
MLQFLRPVDCIMETTGIYLLINGNNWSITVVVNKIFNKVQLLIFKRTHMSKQYAQHSLHYLTIYFHS